MPRSYTVKTILAALDHALEDIAEPDSEASQPAAGGLSHFMLLELDANAPTGFLTRQLTFAWIFGILYFILGFLEGAAEYLRFQSDAIAYGGSAYIVLKILVLVSFIGFQRGFILIGGVFNNYLLKIMAVVLMGVHVLLIGTDIASIYFDSIEREILLLGGSLMYGGIGLFYGFSLTRLENSLGSVAKIAGIVEIITAICFLSVFLSFLGLIMQIPAELLGIILIFKAIEILKKNKAVGNPVRDPVGNPGQQFA